MRVNNTNSSAVPGSEISGAKAKATGETRSVRESKDARKSGAASLDGGAKAEISDRAREVASVKSAAVSAPDVREEKVAELRRRIAAGSYKADAAAIADKMVDEHLETAGLG